ncbi:MAG: phosphoethanolamine--lipid A transferase [Alphaproteobacteria bacterium]|nr:phosphoethanolamine--lipid A transferase [Alphaproteobacteria bacterium]MCL2505286.1 phosphoethanolamine--lipid A transferase [Alphaproteobacteria bacterium]
MKIYFNIKGSVLIYSATIYFASVLNISFWRFIWQNLEITNWQTAWFVFSLIFFIAIPLFLIFNLLIVKKAAKPLLIALLVLGSITNFMMVHYGIYIDRHMIQNALETNTREAFDLITPSLLFWVLLTGIAPSILLIFSKIEYQSFRQELKRRSIKIIIAVLILALLIGMSFKEYAAVGRNHKQIKGLINIVNVAAGTISYAKRLNVAHREFKILDEDAKHVPYEDEHYTVLIFVLGETARADNFSLSGYHKETNPLLKKQDIIYFQEVTSCGTTTSVSVPCMFSHMLRSNFNSTEAKYTENLMDLLQKTGYHIIWKENDDGCKGVCDRIEDVEHMIKTNNPKYCNGKYCYDGVMLEGLEDILKNIQQDTVIVLHTMGSHGPTYYQRYPDEFKKFTPTCDTADIQNCTLPQIVNTYDNTILYTDYIVSSAIDILKKFPQYEAGLAYVSDHGESLGENNVYLHGMPYKIAPTEQTEVPMILWMNENMKTFDYVDYGCMKKEAKQNIYSHDNLFHSILGLLEIQTKEYDRNLDMFRNCRTKPLPFEEGM